MRPDLCLARLARREWLTNGPLSELTASYVESLQTRRYADGTVQAYLRCLAHFSYWMRVEGLKAEDVDQKLITRFIRKHLPTCACPAPRRSDAKEGKRSIKDVLIIRA